MEGRSVTYAITRGMLSTFAFFESAPAKPKSIMRVSPLIPQSTPIKTNPETEKQERHNNTSSPAY